jgi:hypothetical protein
VHEGALEAAGEGVKKSLCSTARQPRGPALPGALAPRDGAGGNSAGPANVPVRGQNFYRQVQQCRLITVI